MKRLGNMNAAASLRGACRLSMGVAAGTVAALAAAPAWAEVIGPDDRVPPTAAEREMLSGLGVIYPEGDLGGTAFLVGDCDVLVTAKHTVLDKDNRPRAARYDYFPGNGSDGIEALLQGSVFGAGYDYADDWIVMRLAEPDPNCRPLAVWAPGDDDLIAHSGRFSVAGFHADRGGAFLLSHNCGIEPACHELARGASEFTHNCDTFQGASGGPIFVMDGTEPRVIGINIAHSAYEPVDICDRSNLARRMSDALHDAITELTAAPEDGGRWFRRRGD